MVEPRGSVKAPRYRVYPVEVTERDRLGPSFVRLTFAGECLRTFGASGFDQRIKLLLPQPGQALVDIPPGDDWYTAWQAMPEQVRPAMRTYTVRAYRSKVCELDIDFVLHGVDGGHGGPASTWASTARPRDHVALVGPDRPGTGKMWGCEWAPPATARYVILVGDETAVPAVGSIVESLPSDTRGTVCLEVPTADDTQCWNVPDDVTVRWSVRQQTTGSAPNGSLLEATVTETLEERYQRRQQPGEAELEDVDVDAALLWEVPDEPPPAIDTSAHELYGWLAGEAGVIKKLRRLMVNDYGIPRTAVSFMGYWRQGRTI